MHFSELSWGEIEHSSVFCCMQPPRPFNTSLALTFSLEFTPVQEGIQPANVPRQCSGHEKS